MSKQINTLDPRQADEMIARYNPVPDDTDILMTTLECLNLASFSFLPPVCATRR